MGFGPTPGVSEVLVLAIGRGFDAETSPVRSSCYVVLNLLYLSWILLFMVVRLSSMVCAVSNCFISFAVRVVQLRD